MLCPKLIPVLIVGIRFFRDAPVKSSPIEFVPFHAKLRGARYLNAKVFVAARRTFNILRIHSLMEKMDLSKRCIAEAIGTFWLVFDAIMVVLGCPNYRSRGCRFYLQVLL